MDLRKIPKPPEGEYPSYAIMYIKLLPDDGRVLEHMRENAERVEALVRAQSEQMLTIPCAPGEWTIKEILGHIIDDERIYTYRALRFARNDTTELPGFEQDPYVVYSGANQRLLDDILSEYAAVRLSTILLFNSFDDAALLRSGVADGNRATVRALAYHIAGHELHHLNSIRENYQI